MNTIENLIEKFKKIEISDFPEFQDYNKPLEMGLWILWIAKEKLGIKKLTADQIVSVIRDVMEISIDTRSITNSFNRAKGKIHVYNENGESYFEIMRPGKDHLLNEAQDRPIQLFYFEPDRRFTSKKILSRNILNNFKDELNIVDPYCNERTLDILKDIKCKNVKILTCIDNLNQKDKERFLREIKDFKSETSNIEFRNYPLKDIHDRYIISSENLIILGHSMKDIGSKESFAIVLNKDTSKNICEALTEIFNRRWKQSNVL
ncbi:MAG: hypothetical protein QXL17_05515 [Candidatus Thermoplasmatota archaeon]